MELGNIEMPDSSLPHAIIFDWDNTLVDSWPVIRDALNTTLTTFGKRPWTMEETRTRVRKSLRESFPDLFGDEWENAADVFYSRYGEIHADAIEPLNGVADMLTEIRALGIYQCVVSNKTGHYLRKEADSLGWSDHFGHIIGANDAARDKPAVDPLHMAMDGSQISLGSHVWFVGDADIDMECAIGAGCRAVLMRASAPENNEFDIYPPELYFDSAEALCKHLRNM